MKESFNTDNFGHIVLSISKIEIEDFEHTGPLSFLYSLKENALKYEGKLNLLITGYDDDPRELHQIEEVQKYFDYLDRVFPYWFFYLCRDIPQKYSPFTTLISLLVPIKNSVKRNSESIDVEFDEIKLRNYFHIHFHYLNELTDELGLIAAYNVRISKEIMFIFEANFQPT